MSITILGIESSCDDTGAAVIRDGKLLSNVTASQKVHESYGGVVPELASRAHQQNIVPVVSTALKEAGISKEELSAVCVTLGPGLMGSLLVGVSFAKGLAASLGIPLIEANHLQGHVMANQLTQALEYPFLCLLVSGGNSQILRVDAYNKMTILGQTIDDAAGEAMDKCSKVMGFGYPGGPIIDKLARKGNPDAYTFAKPNVKNLDYSFSGLKTSFLYFLRDELKKDALFVEHHKEDLAASLEKTIVDILMKKLKLAVKQTGIPCSPKRRCKCQHCPAPGISQSRKSRKLESIYPAIQLHYRQCSNDSHYRILQISGQRLLPIRQTSLLKSWNKTRITPLPIK